MLKEMIKKENNKDRFYGKIRAVVKDINDPEKLGRIRVQCIEIYGNSLSPWAWPCLPYGGNPNTGQFFLPEINSGVWIEFEQGYITNPIWSGFWWSKPNNQNEVPSESIQNYGEHKIIKTKAGHKIEFYDKSEDEKIIITEGKGNAKIILKNETIEIECRQKSINSESIFLKCDDDEGNWTTFSMSPSGITVAKYINYSFDKDVSLP